MVGSSFSDVYIAVRCDIESTASAVASQAERSCLFMCSRRYVFTMGLGVGCSALPGMRGAWRCGSSAFKEDTACTTETGSMKAYPGTKTPCVPVKPSQSVMIIQIDEGCGVDLYKGEGCNGPCE